MLRRFFQLLTLASCVTSAFSQDTFSWTQRARDGLASSFESTEWQATSTAFIVCDMWDYHHSVNAVRRLKEFAPRLDRVLAEARKRGATIIHSPSDCMPFYEDHPSRKRALGLPVAAAPTQGIADWCHRIPDEEQADYPIDQSNGGEDDDLAEHAQWAAYLESIGRPPGNPWQRQTDLLTIDAEKDFIASEGDVVWNVLASKGITQVVLTGVHTNMCVLGRPFGLRQMKRQGKEVLLMRDMTDIMYEPNSWPYVSHFTGIDLVLEHIERHVCPTVTSNQILGGTPFQFRHETRPTVAIQFHADQDQAIRTLKAQLQRDFQVVVITGAGLDLDQSDVLVLPQDGLDSSATRAFADSGRPIVQFGQETAIKVRPDSGRTFTAPKANIVEACYAAVNQAPSTATAGKEQVGWGNVNVPTELKAHSPTESKVSWWRCLALVPNTWKGATPKLDLSCFGKSAKIFVNGQSVDGNTIPTDVLALGALNHIVVRLEGPAAAETTSAPELRHPDGDTITLTGRWQNRLGDNVAWAKFPIPPQFGASTDYIFE